MQPDSGSYACRPVSQRTSVSSWASILAARGVGFDHDDIGMALTLILDTDLDLGGGFQSRSPNKLDDHSLSDLLTSVRPVMLSELSELGLAHARPSSEGDADSLPSSEAVRRRLPGHVVFKPSTLEVLEAMHRMSRLDLRALCISAGISCGEECLD